MVQRIWHGYTKPEDADIYEDLLKTEIFPGIAKKNIDGCKSIQLLRRPNDNQVEFITIMTFETIEAVKAFAGEDYEVAYVPASAKKLLQSYDQNAQHYNLRYSLSFTAKTNK